MVLNKGGSPAVLFLPHTVILPVALSGSGLPYPVEEPFPCVWQILAQRLLLFHKKMLRIGFILSTLQEAFEFGKSPINASRYFQKDSEETPGPFMHGLVTTTDSMLHATFFKPRSSSFIKPNLSYSIIWGL